MKVGIAQIACKLADIDYNCDLITKFSARAAAERCRVLIFPEISDIGYEETAISSHACTWEELPFQTVQRCAKQHDLHIICGLSEKTDDAIYNSVAIVGPDGRLIEKYRKTHLFSGTPFAEPRVFQAGNRFVTVELEGVVFGISICFDLRFPELYRSLTLSGAQVLVNCSAWPMIRKTHWQTLARARAIENQAYFVGANRAGTDGENEFAGASCVIDPAGVPCVDADTAAEGFYAAEIDPQLVDNLRAGLPVTPCRRDDLYFQ